MLHWIIVTNFICSCFNFAIAVFAYCYISFWTEFEYFFTNHSNGFIIFTLFCIVALSYSADRKPLFFFYKYILFSGAERNEVIYGTADGRIGLLELGRLAADLFPDIL